jgi:hypothetical protein
MKIVNLVEWGELLQFAENMKFADWNDAMDILEDIAIDSEGGYLTYHASDFDGKDRGYDYNAKCREIMLAFFVHHKVDTFVLVNS